MTCYLRHLSEVFQKAGIEVTKENKQKLDRVIHDLMHTKYKNCSSTWKEVKKHIAEDETGFVLTLKEAWNKQLQSAA